MNSREMMYTRKVDVDENAALKAMHTIESDATGTAKKLAKEVLGDKGFQALKNLIKK